MMKYGLTIAVSVCALFTAVAPRAAEPQTADHYFGLVEGAQRPNRGGFDHLSLEQLMRELHVPGASIAVIKDFEVHWARGYGVADVQSGAKVDTSTLFQAASISKPVTAMAMLKAVEEGKFALDDDINSSLRSWKIAGGEFTREHPVTARTLASHTSGLGDGFGFPGYSPGATLPTLIQILSGQAPSNVGAVLMERAPMQGMKYSGGGYVVLQLALTERLGKDFPGILRSYVLDPIGMTNSVFEQPLSSARDRNAARGHDAQGKSMGEKWHVYPELAAAGLWTTPTDLAKFAIELQKAVTGQPGRVLSRSMANQMLSPVGVGDYGIGIALEKRGQGWYFLHGGGNWGFICSLLAHKTKGYGLIVMTNSFSGPFTGEIGDRVARAYGWDSLDKPIPR
jgi:CubicO group peptidase (beta-lactamase class C family)